MVEVNNFWKIVGNEVNTFFLGEFLVWGTGGGQIESPYALSKTRLLVVTYMCSLGWGEEREA